MAADEHRHCTSRRLPYLRGAIRPRWGCTALATIEPLATDASPRVTHESPMTYSSNPRHLLRPLFVAAALLLACGDDPQSGTISVRYSVGAANDCSALDIQTVRVDVGTGTESADAPCDPDSPIIIDGIKAGNYPLLVTAVDGEGYTVMDNLDEPSEDDNVEVVGGAARDVDVMLATTPATVRARWVILEDNFPKQCSFALPKTFEVITYENGGNSVLLSHQFECEQNGYATVPDPMREINGQDLDFVTIRMLDEEGAELARVPFAFEPPGPGRTVDFDITCTEADGELTCTGTSSVGEPEPMGTGTGGEVTDSGLDSSGGSGAGDEAGDSTTAG